jgi:hypothetical protein
MQRSYAVVVAFCPLVAALGSVAFSVESIFNRIAFPLAKWSKWLQAVEKKALLFSGVKTSTLFATAMKCTLKLHAGQAKPTVRISDGITNVH